MKPLGLARLWSGLEELAVKGLGQNLAIDKSV